MKRKPLMVLVMVAALLLPACSFYPYPRQDGLGPWDPPPNNGLPDISVDYEFAQKLQAATPRPVVLPDGQEVTLWGTNIGLSIDGFGYLGAERKSNGEPYAPLDHLDAVKAWGYNSVRININCMTWEAVGGPGPERTLEALDEAVRGYTSEGIYIILECHNLTGALPISNQVDRERYATVKALYARMVDTYRDNQMVFFNGLNEPFTEIYRVEDVLALSDEFLDLYGNAQNVILFDLPRWGQGLDVLYDQQFINYARSHPNIVWNYHDYGVIPDEQYAELMQIATDNNIIILLGEFGIPVNRVTSGGPTYEDSLVGLRRTLFAYSQTCRSTLTWGFTAARNDPSREFSMAPYDGPGPDATDLHPLGELLVVATQQTPTSCR